jgi:uncharacterized protein (DUF433 family)
VTLAEHKCHRSVLGWHYGEASGSGGVGGGLVDIYRTPLLTARDAAKHLSMPESTLDAWISKSKEQAPLIHVVDPEKRGWPRLPFIGVVEAYVLRALRDVGARMDDIRLAAELVRRELNDEYALASRRMATDGVAVFVQLADDSLIHVRGSQYAIREVVQDYLRFVTWDEAGLPAQLRLRQYPEAAQVIIDPRFGWGAPVLAASKAPVDAMVQLWRTGEPISVVAEEFRLPERVVEDVLRAAVA